jgi:hypothetical protein
LSRLFCLELTLFPKNLRRGLGRKLALQNAEMESFNEIEQFRAQAGSHKGPAIFAR